MTDRIRATLSPTRVLAEESPKVPEWRAAVRLLTGSRLRVWGVRSALSLVDQGLTSGAGFGVNLLLARWLPAEVYGAFAVAFAGFLFISGFHNVLLLEPFSVFGPARYDDRLPAYFRAQIIIHAAVVSTLSAVVLGTALVLWWTAPGSPLIGAVTGVGLALPFVLLLWLARRMCYVVQRPAIAVTGSGLYLAFVGGGLFLLRHLGRLGSTTAYLLMGGGSVVAAGLLLWRLGLFRSKARPEPTVSWRGALRENWTYGRWLVGSAVLYSVSSQTQTFLVAGFLGLGAAGILRAMQIPSLVMTHVTIAVGLLVLPVFSCDFGKGAGEKLRHKATLVSISLALWALGFAGLLALAAGRAEHLLFGGKYAGYAWLMPVLALIPVCSGFSTGFSMALRASQKPHFDFVANLFAAPVAVVSALIFLRLWGLAGAAASMVLSFGVLSVVALLFFRESAHWKTLPGGSTAVRS
jgi:O-antigen/teichoic acid export membrane protein